MNKPKKKYADIPNLFCGGYNQACDDWEAYHKQALIDARIKEIEELKKKRKNMLRKNSWEYIGEPSELQAIIDYLEAQLKKKR